MSEPRVLLPPEEIPALPDPFFGNKPGPYASSELRQVVGSRIHPDSIGWYKRRDLITSPMCPTKTCAHPELEGWIGDVGGFDPRAILKQPPLSDPDWQMTGVIPRINVYGQNLVFPLAPGWYAVDYPALNTNPAALPTREWVERLKERFPEGTKLMLTFYGNHAVKVGLWTLGEFYHAPFLNQFDAISMPSFSSFSDDPLPQMLIGERMVQIFTQEGYENGHRVIPSVAWTNEDSLRRQIEIWCSLPGVNTITLDCNGGGVRRNTWIWHWLFAMEKYCAPQRHIRWIIPGITPGWAIRELNRIFPDRNYALMPSISMFVRATTKTTDREFMAKRYRKTLRMMEDFRAGRIVADPEPRPDHWPTFAEALKPDQNVN